MWFRNLSVFRLPKNYALSADALHLFLKRQVFAQCPSSDMSSQGWASPRASISLVQRHLRIGYNRAARLIEQMEANKVVGAMASNGNRDVLQASA